MTPDERADVLDKAADYIAEHGLYQGWYAPPGTYGTTEDGARFVEGRPPCCAGGAINMVINGYPADTDAAGSVFAYLRSQVGQIGPWNDAPGRTKEEVVAVLRECAAQLRAAS